MRSITHIVRAIGLGLAGDHKQGEARWLGLTLAIACLFTVPTESKADFIDTFTTGIDPVWTTSVSTQGTPVGSVAFDTDHVKITQSTNYFANIRRSAGPMGVQSVSVDIKNATDTDTVSWSPSLNIYFDKQNWVKFSVEDHFGTFLQQSIVAGTPGFAFGSSDSLNVWYTLELNFNRTTNTVEFYDGPQGGPLTHDSSMDFALPSTFLGGNAVIILGKGNSDGTDNPFLNNDYSSAGTAGGVSLYDNVVLTSVPEPSAVVVLALTGFGLVPRRHSRA
jgi:hypothetical protein